MTDMLAKRERYENQRILDAAQGEACTIRLPKVCEDKRDTVVAAHSPYLEDGMGKAHKSDDDCTAFACIDCHDVLDERVQAPQFSPLELRDYFHRGMKKTRRRLHDKGVIE